MTDNDDMQERQEDNRARLVMRTFYKVEGDNGTNAEEIARYLQNKFGDVWQMTTLVGKAEETLKCGAAMGYLERRGDRYVTKLVREMKCGRRRRRRSRCRRRRRRSRRRRRRRSRCRRRRRSRRRRRRKPSCCCRR